jgi:hypothetical protein
MKVPDLQQLVARFGVYDQITPEGWRDFDEAVAAWREACRRQLQDERDRSKAAFRRGAAA